MNNIDCPCCGQKINAKALPAASLINMPLSPYRKTIIRSLCAAYPQTIGLNSLTNKVYAGTQNGGPDNAFDCVKITISHLKKILFAYGWTIENKGIGRGNTAEYKLKPLVK